MLKAKRILIAAGGKTQAQHQRQSKRQVFI